jgi:predicted transcriptional regulator
MRVLLSIKPEFAEKIFQGTKQFEFRRTIFKNKDIKTVVVYASSPVQKVIGEFEIGSIIKEDLASLWQQTKRKAGIEEAYFYDYFVDKAEGYAIQVKSAKRYKEPLSLQKDYGLAPPQSFLYLKDNSQEENAQIQPDNLEMAGKSRHSQKGDLHNNVKASKKPIEQSI